MFTFIFKLFVYLASININFLYKQKNSANIYHLRKRETCISMLPVFQGLFLETTLKSCKELLSPLQATAICFLWHQISSLSSFLFPPFPLLLLSLPLPHLLLTKDPGWAQEQIRFSLFLTLLSTAE